MRIAAYLLAIGITAIPLSVSVVQTALETAAFIINGGKVNLDELVERDKRRGSQQLPRLSRSARHRSNIVHSILPINVSVVCSP